MDATLIFNPNAGGTDEITVEGVLAWLRDAGYDPIHQKTSSEADLESVLSDAAGLIVVAGGDGTIRAVGRRLIGRDLPVALLPLGTANNIANTLGVTGEPQALIAGLAEPARIAFDVGRLDAPWGVDHFLEGAGYGLYADTLANYDPDKGKSILRGFESISETLSNYQPYYSDIKIDGKEWSGSYLLVEVLNTTAVGPRLKLAPDADPTDGRFNAVSIHNDARDSFLSFVKRFLNQELDKLPSVQHQRGRVLELCWTGFPFHVDGEVRPRLKKWRAVPNGKEKIERHREREDDDTIRIEMLPGALEFWLPQQK